MIWLKMFGLVIALAWSCQGWANETRSRSGIADCPGPGCPAQTPDAPADGMKSGAGQGSGSHSEKSTEKKEEKKTEKKASKKKNE